MSASFTRGDLALIVHSSFKEVTEEEAPAVAYSTLVQELCTTAYRDWFGEWLDKTEPANDLHGVHRSASDVR